VKNHLNTAILTTVLLMVAYSVIVYGAATIELGAPLFVGGSILALLWAVKLFTQERVSWIKSPTHWPVLGFVAYTALRYLTSPVEFDSRVELIYVGFYALLYFSVAFNLYHRRDLTMTVLVLLTLGMLEAIYGIWQFATLSSQVLFAERPGGYTGRASGTFVNPNHLAGFLSIVLGVLLARLVLHRPAIKAAFGAYAGPKIIEGYVLIVATAAIVLSGSRGSWIALGIMLVAFALWAWFPGAVSKWVVGAIGILLVLGSLVIFNAPSARERIAAVITLPGDNQDGEIKIRDATFGQRTFMWTASTKIAGEHPLFGTGPGTWEWFHLLHRDPKLQSHARHAHSDLLQLAAEYGVVGLALVIAFFATYFWHVAQLSSVANYSDQRAFAVGTGLATATLLLHSLVDFHFHVPAIALVLLILVAMGVAMERGDEQSRRIQLTRPVQFGLACALILLACAGNWFGLRLVSSYKALAVAENLRETGDFDEAMSYYQKAVNKDPRQYAAHRGIGDVYLALAQRSEAGKVPGVTAELAHRAIESYRRSEALNRLDPQLFAGLGDAYRLIDDIPAARKAWGQALVLDPVNAALLARLGWAHRDAGLREEAIQLVSRSLDILWNPSNYETLTAMGFRWLPPQERPKPLNN
jgi:O-antigen ligase